jgi:pyruvate dehydrogenase E2 component (dihydrolipoamide acetyltransferase)
LNQVSGSGPNGRITIDDVKNFSRSGRLDTSAAPAATQPLPDFSSFGEISTEKFNNIRRVTAQHLSRSWAIVARVTNHDEADVTELENLRQKYKARVENAGGKLTMTAIMLKILASALKVFPKFNASIDVAKQEIIFKKYFNIGVAVDTERGLLVPVVKNVDRKNITELSIELKEIADRARKGKIGPDELQGGSITITNLGGIGGTSFTPIVNYPEVAILGLSRSSIKPVFLDGEFQPRLILPLSLSYDHRLIDGAEAARFLLWLAEALENPFLVSLEA